MLEKLRNADWSHLPGLEAQLKMAPATRRSDIENIDKSIKYKDSSVLILLFLENGEWQTLLIKRAIDNTIHSGQMAFPGGGFEFSDIDLAKTALRETREEIGVPESEIEILGQLSDLLIPVSGYKVSVFVGYIKELPELKLDEKEVAAVFRFKLREFQEKNNLKMGNLIPRNPELLVPYYSLQNQVIWGATAMILSEFFDFININ